MSEKISLELLDSRSNEKIIFNPTDSNRVKIYSCGPTVYNHSHIGNIRSYVFVDILRRSLKLFGYVPDQTMNITDIDDKIINESIKNKVSIEEFTKPWIDKFFQDLDKLNIERVEHYPRATESIEEMVHMVERLKEQGLVYEKDGSLYYSIQKFSEYGSLSKIDTSGMKAGARYDADEYDKDNVRDFVLWKAPKEEGEKFWETSLGKGRPGWHLECSAMIRSIYKSGIDIHTGGIDLLFPHHENEIAQTKGAYPDEEFVKYWLHCEHLLVDGQKMSKSKGNFFVLDDILSQGYSVKSIRYVLLSFHYRTKLNFSFRRLEESKIALEKIQNTIDRVLDECKKQDIDTSIFNQLTTSKENIEKYKPTKIGKRYLNEFLTGLSDDLNTPKALASVFETIKSINVNLHKHSFGKYSIDNSHSEEFTLDKESLLDILMYFYQINVLLGILEFGSTPNSNNMDAKEEEEIHSLIKERMEAKKNKDFQKADSIRDLLKEKGIHVEDTKDGTVKWKKIH